MDHHECESCTFVASAESIYISPGTRRALSRRPRFLGNFALPGWTGHQRFYALKCGDCGSLVVDYPHSYTGGLLFFSCEICGEENGSGIIPIWDERIYEAEREPTPLVIRRARRTKSFLRCAVLFIFLSLVATLFVLKSGLVRF